MGQLENNLGSILPKLEHVRSNRKKGVRYVLTWEEHINMADYMAFPRKEDVVSYLESIGATYKVNNPGTRLGISATLSAKLECPSFMYAERLKRQWFDESMFVSPSRSLLWIKTTISPKYRHPRNKHKVKWSFISYESTYPNPERARSYDNLLKIVKDKQYCVREVSESANGSTVWTLEYYLTTKRECKDFIKELKDNAVFYPRDISVS